MVLEEASQVVWYGLSLEQNIFNESSSLFASDLSQQETRRGAVHQFFKG